MTLGLTISMLLKFLGTWHLLISEAHAELGLQFLTRMLSMLWRDLFKIGIFTLMLSIPVRNCCICSGHASVLDTYSDNASVPDAHAQDMNQFLMCMLIIFWRDLFKFHTCIQWHISSWCEWSVQAPVPESYDLHAHWTQQFLKRISVHASVPTRILRVHKMIIWKMEKLMSMLCV